MKPSRAVLRLLALLLVSFGLLDLSPTGLGLLALYLAAWAVLFQAHNLGLLAQRIWRMRWFFLAIGILYGLGTPEQDAWQAWSAAAYRVGVLVILVTTVGLCLADLQAEELADGLITLLRPLAVLGLPIEVFARRLAMSLNSVALMDEKLRALRQGERREMLGAIANVCLAAEAWQPQAEGAVARQASEWTDFALLLCILGFLLGLHTLT